MHCASVVATYSNGLPSSLRLTKLRSASPGLMMSSAKRSVIWAHFNALENEKAKCKHCDTEIYTGNGCSGNMNRHMKVKHPQLLPGSQVLVMNLVDAIDEPSTSTDNHNQQRIMELLTKPINSQKMTSRKRSAMWAHFDAPQNKKAKCRYCGAEIYIGNGCSSNLKRHMNVKHPSSLLGAQAFEMNLVENIEELSTTSDNPIHQSIAPLLTKSVKPEKSSCKRSAMWAHFDAPQNKKAKCRYCKAEIYTGNGCSGNLNRHMKVKHPLLLLGVEALEESAVESIEEPTASSVNHNRQNTTQFSTELVKTEKMSTRKRSTMLAHFYALQNMKAKCKYCGAEIYIGNGCSGNRNRHMKLKHPLVLLSAQALKENVEDSIGEPATSPDNQSPQSICQIVTKPVNPQKMDSRKRSAMWTHFYALQNMKAKCRHCGAVICIGNGCSGNLNRHMKVKHPLLLANAFEEYLEVDIDEPSSNNYHSQRITEFSTKPMNPQKMSSRRRSVMWSHFHALQNMKVKCRYCGAEIYIGNGCSGNLNRHMKVKHPLLLPGAQALEESAVETIDEPLPSTNKYYPRRITALMTKQASPQKMKSLDRQLVKMVAKGHHNLRIVDEPEFQKFIEMVASCPNYQLPTRKRLTALLPEVKEPIKLRIQEDLNHAFAVCLTTDEWTSRLAEHYVAVTAHFINKQTELQSVLLCCDHFNERQTSESMRTFLRSIIAEWDISLKIEAVVSNNAGNNINAVGCEWHSISCFAHTLNFVVQSSLNPISTEISQIKRVVEYFDSSTEGLHKLQEIQQQLGIPSLNLKQDVSTRWNSTYDMLVRIVKLKSAIIKSVALLRADLIIEKQTWDVVEQVLPLLNCFYKVTTEISTQKNITLSKIIVFNNLILNAIDKCSPTCEKVIEVQLGLRGAMLNEFRNLESHSLYAEATLLDPRFKHKVFKTKYAAETVWNQMIIKIEDCVTGNASVASNVSPVSTGTERCIWDELEDYVNKSVRLEYPTLSGGREVERYMSEEYLDRKKDPLQWWHERRETYPRLYKLMLKRFCIVATSVPCERIFSEAGQILTDRRSLLKGKNVSTSIFLHINM